MMGDLIVVTLLVLKYYPKTESKPTNHHRLLVSLFQFFFIVLPFVCFLLLYLFGLFLFLFSCHLYDQVEYVVLRLYVLYS